MNKDKQCTIERFLHHTLEIIHMLTGEEYIIVKKNSSQNRIHLLTREVPIKCGDVSVFFSLEEWDYIEEHKDLYVNVMMEKHKPLDSTSLPSPQISGITGVYDKKLDIIPIDLQGEEVRCGNDILETEILLDLIPDKKRVRGDGDESQPFRYRAMDRRASEESHPPDDVEEVDAASRFSNRTSEERKNASYSFQRQDCDRVLSKEVPSPKIEYVSPAAPSFQYDQNLCSLRSSFTGACDTWCHQQRADHAEYDFNGNCRNSPTEKQLPERMDRDKYTYKCSSVGHAGGKVHECAVCGKCYAHKSSLVKHSKTHTGEKDHVCSECGKPFALKYNLVQHLRSHTGEKPYMCATCGKFFAYKSACNQHQKTHNKEKSHTCPECGRCFSRKSSLVGHQAVHAQNKSVH